MAERRNYASPTDLPENQRRRIALTALREMEILAEHLPDAGDRQLLLQYLTAEATRRDMADSLGVPRSNIRRRAARLISRVLQPAFQSVVVHMRLLEPAEQALAREAVLAGRPLRELSRMFDVPVHEISRQRSALQARLRRLAEQPTNVRRRLNRQLNRSIVARQQGRAATCRDMAVVLSVCSVLVRSSTNAI
ncbi:MAG: hypothetical protein PHU85_16710 [Phycisphaerae bacterium]|nr:hypothetical protein [Phycisphaerae bacterium]